MTRLMKLATCAALGLIAHVHGTAQAQTTDDDRARAHFLAGSSYFEQSRFADAHDQFLEAYALSHRVELLLNASMASERDGDLDEAIRLVDAFLAAAPADHEHRISTEARRIELVDRRAHGDAPGDGARGTLGRIGFVTASGGIAFGVVALATGLVANRRYLDLEDACVDHVCPADRMGQATSGRRMAKLSTATTGIGAAGVVVGVVLVLVDGGEAPSTASTTVRPRVASGPGDVGLSVGWSF